MIAYTVHEPKDLPAPSVAGAERVVFVKDGFSWLAAFPYTSVFWLLGHRLWLLAAGYLALVGSIVGMMAAYPATQPVGGIALAALHLALGFEANGLRRWSLERHGYRLAGAVAGRSIEECERRFFDGWFADAKTLVAPASVPPGFNGQDAGHIPESTAPLSPPPPHAGDRQPLPSANPVGDGWERLRAALSDLRR